MKTPIVTESGIVMFALSFLILFFCLWYVNLNPTFGLSTFIIGVAAPLTAGTVLLMISKQRFLLFTFVGYLISLTDDAPVHLDSVLTWPEVTRYQPFVPYFEDFILLGLTLLCFSLAVHECTKERRYTTTGVSVLAFLTLVVFGLSYLQDFQYGPIPNIVSSSWFQLDLLEHLLSGLVLFVIYRLALTMGGRMVPASQVGIPGSLGRKPLRA